MTPTAPLTFIRNEIEFTVFTDAGVTTVLTTDLTVEPCEGFDETTGQETFGDNCCDARTFTTVDAARAFCAATARREVTA